MTNAAQNRAAWAYETLLIQTVTHSINSTFSRARDWVPLG